jgi:hypothetical protein
MPGMCFTVVVVAAMLVVGQGSAMATVEEAAMAAAEEADDGRGGGGLRVYYFYLFQFFFLGVRFFGVQFFECGKRFQNTCHIQTNRKACNPIRTQKLHPKTLKLRFTSPWVHNHLANSYKGRIPLPSVPNYQDQDLSCHLI